MQAAKRISIPGQPGLAVAWPGYVHTTLHTCVCGRGGVGCSPTAARARVCICTPTVRTQPLSYCLGRMCMHTWPVGHGAWHVSHRAHEPCHAVAPFGRRAGAVHRPAAGACAAAPASAAGKPGRRQVATAAAGRINAQGLASTTEPPPPGLACTAAEGHVHACVHTYLYKQLPTLWDAC